MGMIGVVVVGGNLSNIETVRNARLPKKSRQRVIELLDHIG